MEVVTVVLACLWALSEVLSGVDSIESNSVFQLVKNILKVLTGNGK